MKTSVEESSHESKDTLNSQGLLDPLGLVAQLKLGLRRSPSHDSSAGFLNDSDCRATTMALGTMQDTDNVAYEVPQLSFSEQASHSEKPSFGEKRLRGIVARGGSPFPSPTLQRRIVALAHLKSPNNDLLLARKPEVEAEAIRFGGYSASGSLMPSFNRSELTEPVRSESESGRSGSSSPVAIPGSRNELSCGKSPMCLHRRSPLSQSPAWVSSSSSMIADEEDRDNDYMNLDQEEETDKNSMFFTNSRRTSDASMFSLSSRLGGVSAYSSHHPPSPYPSRNHHNLPPPSPSSFSEQPFGSLVGSYEESILSGRMSTLPSRPIPFLAEIGVIGFGKGVKARLKCPPHVNLSFPAYFYDLLDDETPSTPYVGMVDVEGLTGLVLKKDGGGNGTPNYTPSESDEEETSEFKRKWKGGYRLPHKGQIQIVIKNPARTAVKLFLIPYDFQDMPASTKTFLRQKLFSTGTTSTSRRSSLSHRVSLPSLRDSHTKSRSHRLRDAIHLQFRCDAKRRLYLTGSVRVVFSHRAPDSDEKVSTVCEGPENPRYVPCESPLRVKRRPGVLFGGKDGEAVGFGYPVTADTFFGTEGKPTTGR